MKLPPPLPRRILIDCSDTINQSLITGIQRVVRNLLIHSAQAAEYLGVESQPVVFRHGRFYSVKWRMAHDATWRASIAGEWKTFSRRLTPRARDTFNHLATRIAERLRKTFYPRSLARQLSRCWWSHARQPVQVRPGDILLLPDYTASLDMRAALDDARSKGAEVVLLLYDLIPFSHPQYFVDSQARKFQQWMHDLFPRLDAVVGISQNTAHAAQELMAREPKFPTVPCGWFHLGTELEMVRPGAAVRQELSRKFDSSGQAPYLCVCTIEPRKNHALLLDAMELHWASYPQAQLCLAGRNGWKSDELLKRIHRHPRFGRELHLFHDLSDTELDYCYRQAKAFVFPSLVEGFGLPVTEALQRGLRVLASDTPIHREVGGDFCAYFGPHHAQGLATLLARIEQGLPLAGVRPSAEYRPTGWRDSTRELLAVCLELLAKSPAAGQSAAA